VTERDDPLGEDDQLDALEQAHLAAFRAFRRSPARVDRKFASEPTTSQLHPSLNPKLARCVYAGEPGRIYIVPGAGAVCFVSIAAGTGETVRGHTTTELAVANVFGHHARRHGDLGVACVGVLPFGGHHLRILDRTGHEREVPVTCDDGYWIMVADPVEMVWTDARGKDRQSPCYPSRPSRISGQG
jgi:hypothetical protein